MDAAWSTIISSGWTQSVTILTDMSAPMGLAVGIAVAGAVVLMLRNLF